MQNATLERNARRSTETAIPAAAATQAAVSFTGVSKSYGSRRRRVDALSDVTADFPRSSMTAVMGLSGSGKSTLLQLAAGLDHPTSGTVHLGGTDLGKLRRRKLSVLRRRRVGFVFQSFNLVPSLPVAENIALQLPAGALRCLDSPLVVGCEAGWPLGPELQPGPPSARLWGSGPSSP